MATKLSSSTRVCRSGRSRRRRRRAVYGVAVWSGVYIPIFGVNTLSMLVRANRPLPLPIALIACLHRRCDQSWRERYNFEEYCEQRWELTERHARRLMDAASFAEKVTNWSLYAPSREIHIRRLLERLETDEGRIRQSFQRLGFQVLHLDCRCQTWGKRTCVPSWSRPHFEQGPKKALD